MAGIDADPARLACGARAALAEGRAATLLISGLDRIGPGDPEVLLLDDGGRPTFVCAPESPVVAAAAIGRCALLTVAAGDNDRACTTVVLAGRLTRLADDQPSLPGTVLVGLPVEQVVVERVEPRSAAPRHQIVPLELYLRAEPDPLAGYADSLAAHTNACHEPQLRRFVADRAGMDVGHVAGASLSGLDGQGAQIAWVDARGAHLTAIPFDPPAHSPTMLVCRLREQLIRADRSDTDGRA